MFRAQSCRPRGQTKSARRPPRCSRDCLRALSVAESTVRLGQDRRESVRAMLLQGNRCVPFRMKGTIQSRALSL